MNSKEKEEKKQLLLQ